MHSIARFATIAATAISFVAAPLAGATAMPRMGPAKVESVTVEKAGGHKWRRHHHSRNRYDRRRGRDRGFDGSDIAAGIVGVIIGSAIANVNRPIYRSSGNPHVNWCFGHYKSYRAYDNTFQPYHGPRKQCRSPYN